LHALTSHTTGMFRDARIDLHNAMEGMIQGMQHIKAYSTIYALRGVYMGVVNYFAILYFEGGIFGEAVASATRNTFTFCMCLYFLRTHPDAKRYDPRLVHPTKEKWRDFLENGCWLLAMGIAGHLSKFLQPMLTSRLQEEEAEHALGAKLIVGRIGTYPHIVTKVLLTVVVVLGSRYLGSGKADLYKRFITQLLSATGGLSALVATMFFMASSWIYSIYTDHEEILLECNRVTLPVTCQFFIGICSAVVTGMCFASQQFKQLVRNHRLVT
jgi:Na+-driven multidrug efflux pump